MTSEELANKELAQWREKETKKVRVTVITVNLVIITIPSINSIIEL